MILDILNKFWGYDSFRPPQEAIINSLISGKDTLVILPTGGGKSICYQVPAIAAQGTAIVIAPLISLMKDQVHQLTQRGVPAAFLSSAQSEIENNSIISNAIAGNYKLLYIAPERLLSEKFLNSLCEIEISFLAIDEAHCISQWGHDFRPAYRKISHIFNFINRVPIIALTASAIPSVKQDIIAQLQLNTPQVFQESVVRKNLHYQVLWTQSKFNYITQQSDFKSSSIVYCNSRKQTEELALLLRRNGLDAHAYHAGMHKVLRSKVQDEWQRSDTQIMCATSAFGMGIDKPNVRNVVHFNVPLFIESYYQEAGRAGRDGSFATCTLLVNNYDIKYLNESVDKQFPPLSFIKDIYEKVYNFLGITIGEGYEQIYPFHILEMIQKFQLPMHETIAAVKFLQKDGYWQWNETEHIQTRIQITTDQYTIDQLKIINVHLYDVIIALLRTYGAIFHFPTFVNEFDIAKILKINKLDLDNYLLQLHEMGMIYYTPASDTGTLYMLNARLPQNYVHPNIRLYQELKSNFEYRIKKFLDYIYNNTTCRNVYLAEYFGEENITNCGNCDNCNATDTKTITLQELEHKLTQLLDREQYISLQSLEKSFSKAHRPKIIEYLRTLIDQGRITWDATTDRIQKL